VKPLTFCHLIHNLKHHTDVLDQFSPNPILAPPPTSTLGPPGEGRPRQNTRVGAPPPSLPGSSGSKLDLTAEANEDDLSEEFTRELAKGMENLMKDLEGNSSTGEDGKLDEEKQKALRAAWEAMLLDSDSGSGGQRHSDHERTGVDFKARLKNAMNNLKESESKLQVCFHFVSLSHSLILQFQGELGTGAEPIPESLETLLSSLGDGDTDKEIEGFLEMMMGQLLSKDVLQEPLKELSTKVCFPYSTPSRFIQVNSSSLHTSKNLHHHYQKTIGNVL